MLRIRKNLNLNNNNLKEINLSGDALISKLILLVASLCDGISTIKNISVSKDITLLENILRNFGINIINNDNTLVNGLNIKKWKQPSNFIDFERLVDILFYMLNILSKTNFKTFVTMNEGLLNINFDNLSYLQSNNNLVFRDKHTLPVLVNGTSDFKKSKVDVSNTVDKYSIIFNAITNNYDCLINEKELKEEYLESIIRYFGFNIKEKLSEARNILNKDCKKSKEILILSNKEKITGKEFVVPASQLEASYVLFLSSILGVKELLIPNIALNELNTDIIKTLSDNGLNITYKNQKIVNNLKVLDIYFKESILNEVSVSEKRLSNIIDDLPLIIMLNILKKNKINIVGIKELKLKNNKNYIEFLNIIKSINVSVIENKNILEINPEALSIPDNPIVLDKMDGITDKTKLILFLSNMALSKNVFELNNKEVFDVFPNIYGVLEQLNLEIE